MKVTNKCRKHDYKFEGTYSDPRVKSQDSNYAGATYIREVCTNCSKARRRWVNRRYKDEVKISYE